MKIRTAIVDDEPLAREGLADLLRDHPEFEVVGSFDGGAAAVRELPALQPAVLFLDVQMPEIDGFAVLRELSAEPLPLTVFVTAHDEYALRAFTDEALDYLLKPVAADRFAACVQRVRQRLAEHAAYANLRRAASSAKPYLQRIRAEAGGRSAVVPADSIDVIETRGNYVLLRTEVAEHLARYTLNELEAQLDPAEFVRTHRSVIVRLDRISELRVDPRGGGEVRMWDDTTYPVARRALSRLRKQM